MAISIRFSSIHNNYYHYQQNMTPENHKIKFYFGPKDFSRQQKNSRLISKIDSTTDSFNRYETGLGPLMGVAVGGVEHMELYTGRFQWKVYRDLLNWRLVAGGGNRQVKLRAGLNVLIVTKFNSNIPGDKTLCQNALHKFGRVNLFC